MMLGSGRAGTGDEVASWENMRISLDEPDGVGSALQMAFVAAPGGTGWTAFGWSPGEGDERAFLEAFYAQLRARLEGGMRFGKRKADKFSA